MKPLIIAGILLAALGAFILVKGINYGSERSVLTVGDMQVSAEGHRTVPPWVGWGAVIGGVALIGTGLGRRHR